MYVSLLKSYGNCTQKKCIFCLLSSQERSLDLASADSKSSKDKGKNRCLFVIKIIFFVRASVVLGVGFLKACCLPPFV